MTVRWAGVFPAVTTQFQPDQSLDLPATAKHLEAVVASGVAGLVACGSLGENQTLDPDEKRAVVANAVRVAAGRVIVLRVTPSPLMSPTPLSAGIRFPPRRP